MSRSCVHGVVSGKTHRNVTQDDALPPLTEIVRDKVARLPKGDRPQPRPTTLTPKMRALIAQRARYTT